MSSGQCYTGLMTVSLTTLQISYRLGPYLSCSPLHYIPHCIYSISICGKKGIREEVDEGEGGGEERVGRKEGWC